MADLDLKEWFRGEILPYLKVIKSSAASIGGAYKGSRLIVSNFPIEASAQDWVVLSQDDGTNESGIYAYDGSNWGFVQDIASFTEIVQELVASNAEADTGTSTEKVMTIAQIKARYAGVNGNTSSKFSASAPEEGTNEVVRAVDFAFSITDTEAQADYTGA